MNPERFLARRINKEHGSQIAENVVFVDFTSRVRRSGIVGISGTIGSSEIIEFPKGKHLYSPRGKVAKVFDHQGRLVRQRRASRCDGRHNAEENPCGSQRCRTKGRQRLNVKSGNPNQKRAGTPRDNLKQRTFPLGKVA